MASDGGKAGGFTLSLGAAAAKKAAPRRVADDQDGRRDGPLREEVLGFGADGGLRTAGGQAAKQGPLVIPKQENSYRAAAGKFKPSYLPEAADKVEGEGIEKFETAEHDTAVAQQAVTYGLHVRSRPGEAAAEAANGGGEQREQQEQQPAALPADRDAAKLKEDLQALPPEAGLDAYAAMPVDQFGMALLRGMGWTEGKAIGRNVKEEVKAKELVRRPQRLGLGAAPAPEQNQKKYIKPGESRDKKDLVYVDSEGVQRASKPVGEALQERRREGVHAGKVMRVVEGRHSGLMCEVVALEPKQEGRSERARVRLLPSYEAVTVRCSELGEKEEGERRPASREGGRERGGGKRDGGRSGERDGRQEREGKRSKRERDASPQHRDERPWLMPSIRVKIVDKRAKGGKLYLKKGTVVDVKTPMVCDVFVDDVKESVLDLHQSQLETVVSAAEGTPVLVLAGALRGKQGRLLKRNAETGLAAVQLTSDFSVQKLSLDDVAEYVGPLDAWDAE